MLLIPHRMISRFLGFLLVACYATLHPALSVRRSVRWYVRHTLLFFSFFFASCSRLNDQVPSVTAPAMPTRTRLG